MYHVCTYTVHVCVNSVVCIFMHGCQNAVHATGLLLTYVVPISVFNILLMVTM